MYFGHALQKGVQCGGQVLKATQMSTTLSSLQMLSTAQVDKTCKKNKQTKNML